MDVIFLVPYNSVTLSCTNIWRLGQTTCCFICITDVKCSSYMDYVSIDINNFSKQTIEIEIVAIFDTYHMCIQLSIPRHNTQNMYNKTLC